MVNCVKSMYEGYRTCFKAERKVGEYSELKGRLNQGCVMSP